MKHGRLLSAGFGAALVVAGVVLVLFNLTTGGAVAVVVGFVLLVLGVHDWSEVRAEWKDLRFTIRVAPRAARCDSAHHRGRVALSRTGDPLG